MQESKEPLREALNLRIGDKLATEIDRIAERRGKTASETARILLGYGVEVDRRLEAQRLMQHHDQEFAADVAGRVVISAELVPYTWREVAELQEGVEEQMGMHHPLPNRHPTWGDIEP